MQMSKITLENVYLQNFKKFAGKLITCWKRRHNGYGNKNKLYGQFITKHCELCIDYGRRITIEHFKILNFAKNEDYSVSFIR